MDFLNLAKKGYEAYSESQSQSNVSKTGGHEFNSPNNSSQDRPTSGPNFDNDEVVRKAESHGSGSGDLFQTALGFLSGNKEAHHDPVDEDKVTRAHKAAYEQDRASSLSANELGSAAALQVLKSFIGGSGGTSSKSGSPTDLISLAMAEATKLFDKSGGTASGGKQDAVNGAAMTIMKLMVQSKFSGGASTAGGGNSGGLGGLLSLASKFT